MNFPIAYSFGRMDFPRLAVNVFSTPVLFHFPADFPKWCCVVLDKLMFSIHLLTCPAGYNSCYRYFDFFSRIFLNSKLNSSDVNSQE